MEEPVPIKKVICPKCGKIICYTGYFKDERDVLWNHEIKRHREGNITYKSPNWWEEDEIDRE